MVRLPAAAPAGASVVDAVSAFRSTVFIGLYGNNPDPTEVDGLTLASGLDAAGSGSGSGSGAGVPPSNPLIELSNAAVPGYQRAYPANWRQVTDTGLIYLRGTAVFRASGAPPIPVQAYGWFAALPVTNSGVELLSFAPFQNAQAFRQEGDAIYVPLSLLVSQPNPADPASITVDTEGMAFGVATGKVALDTDVHTKSDLQFVRFLHRALKRIPDHDRRALAVHSRASRTSPIPIVDPNDKDTKVAILTIRDRLRAMHELWTGRPLN